MPERLATPEQAEEFAAAVQATFHHGRVVDLPEGRVVKRVLHRVEIPLALAALLPTGMDTPRYGTATLTGPVTPVYGHEALLPKLKLGYEMNPAMDFLSGNSLALPGNMERWQELRGRSGVATAYWRSNPALGIMEHASTVIMDGDAPTQFKPDTADEALAAQFAQIADEFRLQEAQAEHQAWENSRAGVTPPLYYDEAAAVIDFVRQLG